MAQKNIKLNYIFSLVAKIVALLVPILVTPYISRRLGADGVGVCSYIASIVSYFVLFANLGVESYALREISMHRTDENYIKKTVVEISIIKVLMTLLCLAIYYIIFVVALDLENKILYVIYSITILSVAFDFTWFFQGIEKFGLLAALNVLGKLIYIPLVFVFVKDQSDIPLYALFTVSTASFSALLGVPFAIFGVKGKIAEKINPFRHLKPCMVYFLPAIATQIYTVLDKTMIGLITKSDFENGYYERADALIKIPLTFITAINAIMESRTAYYYAEEDFEAIDNLAEKSINFSFMLAFPMTCGWIGIARTFIPIYLGPGFDKCVTLVYILAPIISIIIFSNMLGSHYYTPFGYRKRSALFLVAGAVVNIALNSFMIYFWQSIGAAIASVIAEAVISTLYIIFARKFFAPVRFLKIGWRYLLSALIMGGTVFAMNWFLPDNIGFLILEVAVGIILYALLLLIFRVGFFINNLKTIWNKTLGKIFQKRKKDNES